MKRQNREYQLQLRSASVWPELFAMVSGSLPVDQRVLFVCAEEKRSATNNLAHLLISIANISSFLELFLSLAVQ